MITPDDELEFLRRRANELGLYLNRHKYADATGGDLYVQEKRKFHGEKMQSLRKYATAAECWEFLTRYAREHAA